MDKYHKISKLKFEDDSMIITIDGQTRKYKLKEISKALDKASIDERNNYEISPSGYGIHWPLLDEDISIDALLGIVHTPEWKKKDCITML